MHVGGVGGRGGGGSARERRRVGREGHGTGRREGDHDGAGGGGGGVVPVTPGAGGGRREETAELVLERPPAVAEAEPGFLRLGRGGPASGGPGGGERGGGPSRRPAAGGAGTGLRHLRSDLWIGLPLVSPRPSPPRAPSFTFLCHPFSGLGDPYPQADLLLGPHMTS